MERRPRILLVDDEAAITSKLAPFLERAGFMVDVADNGEAALLRVASFAPDLMILDVLMPKLDGREVCRRLRAAGNMAMGLVAAWGLPNANDVCWRKNAIEQRRPIAVSCNDWIMNSRIRSRPCGCQMAVFRVVTHGCQIVTSWQYGHHLGAWYSARQMISSNPPAGEARCSPHKPCPIR